MPKMAGSLSDDITFVRLTEVDPQDILTHMSDPRVAEHLPLLTGQWDMRTVADFIATKQACWTRDGLGHWAILQRGAYIGWGGFQKEGDDWDYGLVLKPEAFGLGLKITRKALAFAKTCHRIQAVTFLLPPSRKALGALGRMGAEFVGHVDHEGSTFLKYSLNTT